MGEWLGRAARLRHGFGTAARLTQISSLPPSRTKSLRRNLSTLWLVTRSLRLLLCAMRLLSSASTSSMLCGARASVAVRSRASATQMGMEVGVPLVPRNFYHAGRCDEAVQKGMGRVGPMRYRAFSSTGARTALSGTESRPEIL